MHNKSTIANLYYILTISNNKIARIIQSISYTRPLNGCETHDFSIGLMTTC